MSNGRQAHFPSSSSFASSSSRTINWAQYPTASSSTAKSPQERKLETTLQGLQKDIEDLDVDIADFERRLADLRKTRAEREKERRRVKTEYDSLLERANGTGKGKEIASGDDDQGEYMSSKWPWSAHLKQTLRKKFGIADFRFCQEGCVQLSVLFPFTDFDPESLTQPSTDAISSVLCRQEVANLSLTSFLL